jgi:hypothetical protein
MSTGTSPEELEVEVGTELVEEVLRFLALGSSETSI